MASSEGFPTRVLRLSQLEALGEESVDPGRINQHIEGIPDPTRVMSDDEVERLLGDPFATLVLRRGVFPRNLTELLDALDAFDGDPGGLPEKASFLIAEGGQIPFRTGLDKGNSRLIVVRGRSGAAEVMISALLPAGVDPRGNVLLEVQSWDPANQTMHFYQRQSGAWFWCGQSDMALVAPTRGEGAWDSHVNGYPLMKELKSPWVHWHGPGLGIPEDAYAVSDPLRQDPLFIGRDHALNFENFVIRPLAQRWNEARFAKATAGGALADLDQYVRQFADSSTANLISTHKEWSSIDDGGNLDDIPATFFIDVEGLLDVIGLSAPVPSLTMQSATYKSLAATYGLRVRGDGADQAPGEVVDLPGDVPFCFLVPERAFEDTVALQKLVQTNTLSRRLAAAVLMVDFTNPLFSPTRRALQELFPNNAAVGAADGLDETVIANARTNPSAGDPGSPVGLLLANWDLGPSDWELVLSSRAADFLGVVSATLTTTEGCDDIFRLAESRRREFRLRPLAEFGLSLPQAVAIPEDAPFLEMLPDGSIQPRELQE